MPRKDHAQEALDSIDEALLHYADNAGAAVLRAMLTEEEKAAYWNRLAQEEADGLITTQEVADIYLRHGWGYETK